MGGGVRHDAVVRTLVEVSPWLRILPTAAPMWIIGPATHMNEGGQRTRSGGANNRDMLPHARVWAMLCRHGHGVGYVGGPSLSPSCPP